ncbi:MAG: cobalamin biosynthesis protein, partial [Sporomusaceae bacterium]|nr:cobalamin biosynthesis protein [Sporomusaceae bacterium]
MLNDFLFLVLALGIDRLLGDPRSTLHPVVLTGNLIAWLEKIFLNPAHGPWRKRIAGAALVAIVLGVVYTVTYFAVAIAAGIGFWAAFLFGAFLLSFTISPRSLKE